MNFDVWKMPLAKRKVFVRSHRGFLSRVARQLDPPVTPTAVFLILQRKGTSARIKSAIEKEMDAILRAEAAAQ